MQRAVSTFLMTLGLAGCSTLLPPNLPELQPAFRREKVTSGWSTCGGDNCRNDIKVGSQRFRVETKTRVVSAKELTGANAAERVAGGLLGWGLRRAGLTTVDDQIVVGTRTVTSEGSSWRLECSVAWLDQRERSKDETAHLRISEGIDCVQRLADSAAVQSGSRWRFRYGVLPSVDSMAAIADTLGLSASGGPTTDPVLHFQGDTVVEYRLIEESFGSVLGTPRSGGWQVSRKDRKVIGALRLPPAFSCLGHCALDLGAVTAEEENTLRFIAAALMVPLQR
jgi:hypothetical protein